MNTTKPLLDYLETHQFISSDLREQITDQYSHQDITQLLHDSGVLSLDEISRLESLFSGFPVATETPKAIDRTIQALIPYDLSQQHRVVCVDQQDGALCVVTDQSFVAPELFTAISHPVYSTQRVSQDIVDHYLDQYRTMSEEELLDQVAMLGKKVRTIESYGSASMAAFFPQDHKQEIAEDLSSLLLIRRLLESARLKQAQSVTLRAQSDKLVVSYERHSQEHEWLSLDKKLEGALFLKLRYLCDLRLDEPQEIERGIINELFPHEEGRSYEVTFVPHVLGMTMIITDAQQARDMLLLETAGFSNRDSKILIDYAAHNKSGLVMTSGVSQSGKTFAMYHVLEAMSVRAKTATLEERIEYVIDGVDQLNYSKRPEKDLQMMQAHYNVLGLLPLYPSLLQAAYNQSLRSLVIADVPLGVMATIKELSGLGITPRELKDRLTYNVVSYRYPELEATVIRERRLEQHEIDIIDEYCSIREYNQLLQEEGIEGYNYASWKEVSWPTAQETKQPWWHFSRLQHPGSQKESFTYIRSVVAIGEVIARVHREGGTINTLEQELKQKQKQALAQRTLIGLHHKQISIESLIGMLRA